MPNFTAVFHALHYKFAAAVIEKMSWGKCCRLWETQSLGAVFNVVFRSHHNLWPTDEKACVGGALDALQFARPTVVK